MGKYKYLANNIVLFSVSNFVSKILVFLLVPFYTGILTTAEYGTADVFQTTLLLTVPALTVNMGESALRFGIGNADSRGLIFRIGLKYTLRASLIVFAGGIAASFFAPFGLTVMFVLLFFTDSVYEFLILFFQGCELVKIVVSGSIFSTLILILSNLLCLLVLKLGLYGYLISQMAAYFLASVFMLALAGRNHGEVFETGDVGEGNRPKGSKGDPKKQLEKEMLDYGKPMIFYSTGAWINNAADRYFVSAICGLAVNGLYGVAYKIPSILTVFQRIFAQAWQMSATREKAGEDEAEDARRKSAAFYSEMYRLYLTFMVLGCGFLILFVKPLAFFLFRKDFYEAWRFVPPLLISVVFGAMTGFLGSICLAYKDSKSMGAACGIGAAVNVVLNLLLIPEFSAMGAAFATAVSYLIMYIMAFLFVRKHVKLETDILRDVTALLCLSAEAAVMINGAGDLRTFAVCAGICLILVLINLRWIRTILQTVAKRLKRG